MRSRAPSPQAMRDAGEQKVKAVAVSDWLMLYAGNIADGGLRDRGFVSLSACEPPLALWWLAPHAASITGPGS